MASRFLPAKSGISIRDHVADNLGMEWDEFELSPLAQADDRGAVAA